MLRCDSARMSTSVTAPFGKITWLVSRTWPWPAATAAADSEVSRATSVTGAGRVSLPSTAYSTFGVSASPRRSSANLLAASMPGMMWEDTVRSADQRDQPDGQVPPAAGEHIEDTTYMDIDAVVADVASAVGLAEGRSGVVDVLRAIARSEPVAVREVSRTAELPVPIVAAVCNELRKRGVVDRARPVQLTPEGRELLASQHPDLSAACPCCGGSGVAVPDALAGLTTVLERAAAGTPRARPELDQTHCTVGTKIRRGPRRHEAGALARRRSLMFGDADLLSVAIAAFAATLGQHAGLQRLARVRSDPQGPGRAGGQSAAH